MTVREMADRYRNKYEPIRRRVKIIKYSLSLVMAVFIGLTIAIILYG